MIATAHLSGLGTDIAVSVTEPSSLESAVRDAARHARNIELTVDRSRPGAEIHAVDVAAGAPVLVSAVMEQIVARALYFADITDGATQAVRRSSIPDDRFLARMRFSGDGSAPVVITSSEVAPVWHRPRLSGGILEVPADVRLELVSTGRAFLADRAAHRIADRLQCGVMVSVAGVTATAGHPPLGGWRLDAAAGLRAVEIPAGWACAVVTEDDVARLPRSPFDARPHSDHAAVRVIAHEAGTAAAATILTHIDPVRAQAWAEAEDMVVTASSAHAGHAAA
ncbi:FAD:protein FMN transferase [Williamsia deligens]|uniref:FAD:protein FMN transferase n=1 Tax=Williamsia deligens TaxID=321325 RepID=A0ABW3GAW5_9NOCA|nr:FAD:protein FMN transferase [Williamsia deligens]MCP2193177.1 thiamine biosynthesis lipoprotein [Williamsia deligens]